MMAARLSECEELLQEFTGRLGEADQLLIRRTLEKVGYLVLVFRLSLILESKQDMTPGLEESLSPHSFRRRRTSDEDTQGFDTEYQATGRVGSTESLDCITEDFNRSDASRSTGYMGKNSEIAWMGKLRQQTDAGLDEADGDSLKMNFGSGLDELYNTTPKDVHRQLPLNESTYHCDDIPLSAEENVQAYQLPPRATADVLLACYLECVHPAFPILGKTTFTKQYQAFYDNPNLKTGPKWLAVLNLIFAIGARYSCLARADSRGLLDDHQTYFSRARVLGMDAGTVWVHAELQRIQITGLASFYLMATHQINRYRAAMFQFRAVLTWKQSFCHEWDHDPTGCDAGSSLAERRPEAGELLQRDPVSTLVGNRFD